MMFSRRPKSSSTPKGPKTPLSRILLLFPAAARLRIVPLRVAPPPPQDRERMSCFCHGGEQKRGGGESRGGALREPPGRGTPGRPARPVREGGYSSEPLRALCAAWALTTPPFTRR